MSDTGAWVGVFLIFIVLFFILGEQWLYRIKIRKQLDWMTKVIRDTEPKTESISEIRNDFSQMGVADKAAYDERKPGLHTIGSEEDDDMDPETPGEFKVPDGEALMLGKHD
jgi:hypothetical protein